MVSRNFIKNPGIPCLEILHLRGYIINIQGQGAKPLSKSYSYTPSITLGVIKGTCNDELTILRSIPTCRVVLHPIGLVTVNHFLICLQTCYIFNPIGKQ